MRKLAVILGLAALVVLAATPVMAGGIAVMYSTWDTDTADDDQGAGVKIEIDMNPNLDLEFRASFFDSFAQVDRFELYEIEATPIDMGFAWHFIPDGRVNPYLGAGGTFLLISPNPAVGEEETSRPHSQEEFGWYGEAGIEFVVADQFSIFVEALYRDASGEVRGRDLGTAPQFDFEVDFGGVAANFGFMFRW